VVGGTGLYFKALLEGLSVLPPADPQVRARLEARARQVGWTALHAELAGVDPATAARIRPTDPQRIQRALEVFEVVGRPLSEIQGARERSDVLGPTLAIALLPSDRARLHTAIAHRFDAMLAAGLVAELRGLRWRYALAPGFPSMRCVGYRQAWEFLDGGIDADTLRTRGVAATRQLARRQLTWLRSTPAHAFDPLAPGIFDAVASLLSASGLRPD
jgi:tRNA dimethylallyltransferase